MKNGIALVAIVIGLIFFMLGIYGFLHVDEQRYLEREVSRWTIFEVSSALILGIIGIFSGLLFFYPPEKKPNIYVRRKLS